MSTTKYSLDYFINKFEAIHENDWITGEYEINGRRCALGHCGVNTRNFKNFNEEAEALKQYIDPICINDGLDDSYNQSTPKARILAALKDIKEGN